MNNKILFNWDIFFSIIIWTSVGFVVLYGFVICFDSIFGRCKRAKLVPIAEVVFVNREEERLLNIQEAYVV